MIKLPVEFENKTQYGCVIKLKTIRVTRVAKDPHTAKEVDKTLAYIVLMDRDGRVDYIESKENFINFKNEL